MTDKEFAVLFDKYMSDKRDEMKARFNRVLPSGEYIFNRFEKAPYLGYGKNTSIYDTSVVLGDVEVGDNVWIGPYTLLDGFNAKLRIGNYVSIDSGVMIYTHDTTRMYVSGGIAPAEVGDVTIGNCTVLGTMSIVSCGVTIGNHCIIGAHSYVNTDIPDCSIAAGIPAKIIGKVELLDGGEVRLTYY